VTPIDFCGSYFLKADVTAIASRLKRQKILDDRGGRTLCADVRWKKSRNRFSVSRYEKFPAIAYGAQDLGKLQFRFG
jgi:hypothetical protein